MASGEKNLYKIYFELKNYADTRTVTVLVTEKPKAWRQHANMVVGFEPSN